MLLAIDNHIGNPPAVFGQSNILPVFAIREKQFRSRLMGILPAADVEGMLIHAVYRSQINALFGGRINGLQQNIVLTPNAFIRAPIKLSVAAAGVQACAYLFKPEQPDFIAVACIPMALQHIFFNGGMGWRKKQRPALFAQDDDVINFLFFTVFGFIAHIKPGSGTGFAWHIHIKPVRGGTAFAVFPDLRLRRCEVRKGGKDNGVFVLGNEMGKVKRFIGYRFFIFIIFRRRFLGRRRVVRLNRRFDSLLQRLVGLAAERFIWPFDTLPLLAVVTQNIARTHAPEMAATTANLITVLYLWR